MPAIGRSRLLVDREDGDRRVPVGGDGGEDLVRFERAASADPENKTRHTNPTTTGAPRTKRVTAAPSALRVGMSAEPTSPLEPAIAIFILPASLSLM